MLHDPRRVLSCFALLSALAAPAGSAAAQDVRFLRGQVDQTGGVDMTDAVIILRYLFLGEWMPPCLDAADIDDSGNLNITDGVLLLNFLFLGGAQPAEPFASCGADPTSDDVGCAIFEPCAGPETGLDARPPTTGCSVLDRPPPDSPVALERAFAHVPLSGIVNMVQAPGDRAQWYAVRRAGYIYQFDVVPPHTPRGLSERRRTVLDFTSRIGAYPPEGGLVSMAFHPDFATNGKVFLFYMTPGPPIRVHVSSFTSLDLGRTIDPASEVNLLTVDQASTFHHGGHLAFGLDHFLYVGLGDSGTKETGQDPNDLRGSMLRLDVDGGAPYGIPPDNPFAAGGGRPEIYALGLRQPWRWSFDQLTGDIWVGDVGNNEWEEINRVERAGNYGWPVREGAHCSGREPCDVPGLTDPVVEYSHEEGSCVIGGYVYRGSAVPELEGVYIYGDWGAGKIWGLFKDVSGNRVPRLLLETGWKIPSFAQDLDGEVYVIEGTEVHKIVRAPDPKPDAFPSKLSRTGYVDPADPKRPSACMIPYDINVPFWSDTAEKERWLLLPDATTIDVKPDGEWDFPIGTVFMKHFRLEGALIETRLLMRHADGEWGGYSYEWDAGQADATLLPADKTVPIGTTMWTYPSRSQCLQCHTQASGRVLGLETAQLNKPILYPATGRTANQLATLDRIGAFTTALPGTPDALPSYPAIVDESVPLETRARAYLHANCSHCHRPGGAARGNADMRFSTPALQMNICNAVPSAEDIGIPGARIVKPGDPLKSIVSIRMHDTGSVRMPPIGRNVVDAAGAALIDAWISSWIYCDPAEASSVIVDNGDLGTSFIGNWSQSSAPGAYGTDSIYSQQEGASYTYDTDLPQPGTYDVYLWWTEWPSRWNSVPVEITHSGGVAPVVVNQQENGARWNWVGTWDFGTTAKIRIIASGQGSTNADAVRLSPK